MDTRQDSLSNYQKDSKLVLWKQLVLFLVGWLGFQLLASIISVVVVALPSNVFSGSTAIYTKQMLINSLSYLILAGVLFGILNIDTVKLVKSFAGWKPYVAAAICVASIFSFSIIWNSVLSLIEMPVVDNVNQSSLESIEKVFPVASIMIFGIVGPICEELTYRVGLFSLCKRRSTELAYFVTIIVFAFIHFSVSKEPLTLLNEILNLPHYMFAAAAFSFVYHKFGFASSVTAHITNNLISLIIRMIIK